MLFHEALHLVFTTFSRKVLQQGRLTNYLADCSVFDTFDDRRTICLAIDSRYGAHLYACLCHSPYKQQFDAIVAEVKQQYPNVDSAIVDYIFQSIRFAWGKIHTIKVPKDAVLFPPPKGHRQSVRHTKNTRNRPKHFVRRRLTKPKRSIRTPKRPKMQPYIASSASSRRTMHHHTNQTRISQVVMYILIIIYIFAASVSYFTGHIWLTWIFIALVGLFLYIRVKFL